MDSQPLISFIVPAYNVEKHVESCLSSIIDQELEEKCEIIVVNDGSTDQSLRVIQHFAEKHSCVQIIAQKNQGLSSARNIGIKHAKGQFIYFVDSDDYLVPNSLKKVLDRALETDADVACFKSISGTRGKLKERIININYNVPKSLDVLTGDEYIATHNFLATVWWYIIKRDYLMSLNLAFPVGHRLEDGSFTPFVLLQAKRIIHIETTVYCYVVHSDSIMHNKTREQNLSMLEDYAFAGKNLIASHEKYVGKMSKLTSDRWMGLANSYLFFGMIKALRLGESKYMIKHLKSLSIYPFGKMSAVDYPGTKWNTIHWLMNHETIWVILSLSFKIFKFYK